MIEKSLSLEKILTKVGDIRDEIEVQLRDLTGILCGDLPENSEILIDTILLCVENIPLKVATYATLVGLINLEKIISVHCQNGGMAVIATNINLNFPGSKQLNLHDFSPGKQMAKPFVQ